MITKTTMMIRRRVDSPFDRIRSAFLSLPVSGKFLVKYFITIFRKRKDFFINFFDPSKNFSESAQNTVPKTQKRAAQQQKIEQRAKPDAGEEEQTKPPLPNVKGKQQKPDQYRQPEKRIQGCCQKRAFSANAAQQIVIKAKHRAEGAGNRKLPCLQ
ncbi:MAG: hypothetical protein IJS31_00835 [Oscillospiraceae bacterium]|nr:hypothetical protein [Oscillospiraceae bacterium]